MDGYVNNVTGGSLTSTRRATIEGDCVRASFANPDWYQPVSALFPHFLSILCLRRQTYFIIKESAKAPAVKRFTTPYVVCNKIIQVSVYNKFTIQYMNKMRVINYLFL